MNAEKLKKYIKEIHKINNPPVSQVLATLRQAWGALDETEKQRDELLEVANWINDIISTACDGGDAWCAIRNRPGAKEWADKLKAYCEKGNESKQD